MFATRAWQRASVTIIDDAWQRASVTIIDDAWQRASVTIIDDAFGGRDHRRLSRVTDP